MIKYDVVIIGGGAAGLFCAANINNPNLSILVLEKNNTCGKKILVSGGGRCNFTNLSNSFEDYNSQNIHFPKSALKNYTSQDFISLIEGEGIKYVEKKLGQLFCLKTAKPILEMLLKKCNKKNIEIQTGARIGRIDHFENYFTINVSDEKIKTNKLIVATGGVSYPALGASDLGYKLAMQFGHKIVNCRPGLVGINLSGFKQLAGTSVIAEVQINKFNIKEEVLFTHKGLSGPSILKASLFAENRSIIKINWLPTIKILEDLDDKSITIQKYLNIHLPKKFTELILNKLSINKTDQITSISKKQLNRLSEYIHNFKFENKGTFGYRRAEVTVGGVDTNKVSSKTMESQLLPGLYFIGEVLDVTGQLGGHNFQWAWSSAYAVGRSLSI